MLRVLPFILMPRFEYFATFFLVNIITTVLSSFIINPHLFHHLLIALICFCSSLKIKVRFLPDLHAALSSAYNEHIVLSSLTDCMSLIINRNKIGGMTLPCGVGLPFWSRNFCDSVLPTLTLMLRSVKKSFIHL